MGCTPSKPPKYTPVEYLNKSSLVMQLKTLVCATDPLKWKLAYVQASTRIAISHNLQPIDPNMAFRRMDVVVRYAHLALFDLANGHIKCTDGFCT